MTKQTKGIPRESLSPSSEAKQVLKESPMLFNGDMVRQIIAGNKTQTRRMNGLKVINEKPDDWELYPNKMMVLDGTKRRCVGFTNKKTGEEKIVFFPYGKIGDILWVRETLEADYHTDDRFVLSRYTADKSPVIHINCDDPDYNGSVQHWKSKKKAIPSIHMPKDACRIWLKITSFSIVRIQNIDRNSAAKEGMCFPEKKPKWIQASKWPEENFQTIWKIIHGKNSWAKNDFVWKIDFEISTNPQLSKF